METKNMTDRQWEDFVEAERIADARESWLRDKEDNDPTGELQENFCN